MLEHSPEDLQTFRICDCGERSSAYRTGRIDLARAGCYRTAMMVTLPLSGQYYALLT
jgi:hypothetical protein